MTSFFIKPTATASAVILLVSAIAPSANASSNHTFTGGDFGAVASSSTPFTMGIGGFLGGQRMLLDNASSIVTFTISASDSRDLSAAECSFSPISTQTNMLVNGQIRGVLTSAPSAGSVDCTFESKGLIGSFFHVRVGGQASAEVLFYLNNGRSGSGSGNSTEATTPTPAKYSGPEFSSLSLKPVMHGSSTTLTGKRLSQVSSIEIGGKAATFTATSDTELSLTPAADLAPGTYDLVINSAAGKLTHINAVRIQPALRSFSVTTRAENRITEEQYQEHSLIASIQQAELTKARCIVNGPNLGSSKGSSRASLRTSQGS